MILTFQVDDAVALHQRLVDSNATSLGPDRCAVRRGVRDPSWLKNVGHRGRRRRTDRACAGVLVAMLKTGGAAALAEVSKELERLAGDKALAEHEPRDVQQQLYELRRGTIDAARSAEVIGDLRLLYEAARPDQRRELIRLASKRITNSGPKEPVQFELDDGGGVNLPPVGSKLSNEWLPVASRAAIARRDGISKARVTQILKRLQAGVAGRRRAG